MRQIADTAIDMCGVDEEADARWWGLEGDRFGHSIGCVGVPTGDEGHSIGEVAKPAIFTTTTPG